MKLIHYLSGFSWIMHLRLLALCLMVMVLSVGCANRTPSNGPVFAELPALRDFKADPYIQAAIELQKMGKTNALAQLHIMSQEENYTYKVVILCRMLFTQHPGSNFRRPYIGGTTFPGETIYSDWPLEPIEIVDGVPFSLTGGYMVGGFPEPEEWYLKYCMTECDWSDYRYTVKTESQKKEALNKLFASEKWKKPLSPRDKRYFSGQL